MFQSGLERWNTRLLVGIYACFTFVPSALAEPKVINTLTVLDRGNRPHAALVTTLNFSPDDRHLVLTLSTGEIEVWDWSSGTMSASTNIGGRTVCDVRFPMRNRILVICSSGTAESNLYGTLRFAFTRYHWACDRTILPNGGHTQTRNGVTSIVQCIPGRDRVTFRTLDIPYVSSRNMFALNAQGTRLLWATEKQVSMRDASTGSVIWEKKNEEDDTGIHSMRCSSLAFSPSGENCAVAISAGGVFGSVLAIFDSQKGELENDLLVGSGEFAFLIPPSESHVITWQGGCRGATIWTAASGKPYAILAAREKLTRLAISNACKLAAAVDAQGQVLLWDLPIQLISETASSNAKGDP